MYAAAVFVSLLSIYLLTIIPTVVDQDSGELVTAAHVLGVAHPTGYPLWVMLARLFDLLPLGGTSAWRVAVLSAVGAAGAGALLAWLVGRVSGVPAAGLFAGLAFGLWFPTWSQAVLAEVYGLAALIYALFLIAAWRWEEERSERRLSWLALAAGWVAMHHRTQGLAAGPLVLVALWLTRPSRPRAWAKAAVLMIVPFACYLYLPIRAAARPALNWGDPSTLARFLDHAAGRQYLHLAFANPAEVAWRQTLRLLSESLAGPGWPSWALAAVVVVPFALGVREWWRAHRGFLCALLTGAALLWVWVVHWGDTYDQKVFLTPVGALAALVGGRGMGRLAVRRPWGMVGMSAAGAVTVGLLLGANWARSDRANEWKHRDQWAGMLAQMESNAILVAESDNPVNAVIYLQQVEGRRRDVTLIEPTALWSDWYARSLGDAELGAVAERWWREITSERGVHSSQGLGYGQCAAVLAARLAEKYRGRRPVYALHGPLTEALPAPPYFVGLTQDLVRLAFEMPVAARRSRAGAALATGPQGAELAEFSLGQREAGTGDLVEFRAAWRLREPLQGWGFALRLRPAEGDPKVVRQFRRMGGERKAFVVQGFKPVYGLWGLPASPPGTVYEQAGKLVIPSNLPPGRYTVEIGFAPRPPEYAGWTRLGPEGGLVVEARPLPTNGP